MKKRSVTMPCILGLLILVLGVNGSAQQGGLKEKMPASASLELAFDQLKRELKESVALDFRHGYARRTYVRLKRRDGCNITFQYRKRRETLQCITPRGQSRISRWRSGR